MAGSNKTHRLYAVKWHFIVQSKMYCSESQQPLTKQDITDIQTEMYANAGHKVNHNMYFDKTLTPL